MITYGYRNGSSIIPLQVQDTLFSAMVLLCHIHKLRHWLDSSLPLDILLFSAIAFWSLVTCFRCDFFIKSLDDIWHIVHATVSDFNCTAVENFVKLVTSWKMFCYQLKECYNVTISWALYCIQIYHGKIRHRLFIKEHTYSIQWVIPDQTNREDWKCSKTNALESPFLLTRKAWKWCSKRGLWV